MSRKFDHFRFQEDEADYGERLHREKTKRVKRGKDRRFEDFEYAPPRREKPLRRNNTAY